MKRVMIACFLLLILATGCFLSSFSIDQITDDSDRAVRSAANAAAQNNFPQALAELQHGQTKWDKTVTLLSALVDHQALDEIDTLYRQAICYASANERSHLLAELAALSAALERMQEAEHLSLETIL